VTAARLAKKSTEIRTDDSDGEPSARGDQFVWKSTSHHSTSSPATTGTAPRRRGSASHRPAQIHSRGRRYSV
jgi:hypothetical protein